MTVIRRVPVDFDWPLKEVWGGFVMPESLRLPPCPDCNYSGSHACGYSPAAWGISETFYATSVSPREYAQQIAWHDKITQAEVDHLLSEGRLRTWEPGAYTDESGLKRNGKWVAKPLTAAEVNARQASMDLDSHDASNRVILIRFRCERLGLDLMCPTCEGTCHVGTPEQIAARDAWKPTPIPTGEGWQAWEDISEGSPISPVFATRDGLAHWFTTWDSIDGVRREPLTRAEAEALVDTGSSVGTFATIDGVLMDGDSAVAAMAKAQS